MLLSTAGNSVSCPTPASVFQGSRSFSGTSAGSTVSYKCDKGTYMVGSASATCTDRGTWSAQPPECRVEYTTKKDNTFKNGDKGYKLYSG